MPEELQPLVASLNGLLARLSDALAAQRRFTADAAHELRTPLAALKLQLDLARRDGNASNGAAALDDLEAGVARASHVVEQLLTLARVEPEVARAEAQRLRSGRTRARRDRRARARSPPTSRSTSALHARRPATVSGDPASLAILLSNLIDNALRYTPRGGRIDVAVDRDETGATLSVADTGPGIPAEDRERVFDRFVPRQTTTTSRAAAWVCRSSSASPMRITRRSRSTRAEQAAAWSSACIFRSVQRAS